MDGRPETNLAAFPASELFDGTTIAVETKYAIPGRGNSLGRSGYTMSLRHVFVLAGTDLGYSCPGEPHLDSYTFPLPAMTNGFLDFVGVVNRQLPKKKEHRFISVPLRLSSLRL
jgi:hypothetical protein